MGVALNVEVLNIDADTTLISTQMMKKFRVSMTFGQVTNIYEPQGLARMSNDEDEDIMC
jgi:hypothetical protein